MFDTDNILQEAKQWKVVHKIAGISAIMILAFIPIQIIVFSVWPPTFGAAGWFALFHRNKFAGLVDMDLFLMIDYALTLFIYIALWGALKKTNSVFTTIALLFQLASAITYFSSNGAFEMLYLSNKYAAAATEAEKSMYLASGETIIAIWQGTAFTVSYWLGCIATITIAMVMMRSDIFSKLTAWLGLAAGILMIIPPNFGIAGLVISFISLIPTIGWLILLGRQFLSHRFSAP